MVLILTTVLLCGLCSAEILRVPENYSTISIAVDQAGSGDTVLISPGTYLECVSVPCNNLTFASTYIETRDSADIGSTVWRSEPGCHHVSTSDCGLRQDLRILGLSLIGAFGPGIDVNGGVLSIARNLTLQNCKFDSCAMQTGGVLFSEDSEVLFESCWITRCDGNSDGRLISQTGSTVELSLCEISASVTSFGAATPFWIENGALTVRDSRLYAAARSSNAVLFTTRGDVQSVQLIRTSLSRNTFANLYVQEDSNPIHVVASECRIDSNSVKWGLFSGLGASSGSTFDIEENTFLDNSSMVGFRAEPMIRIAPNRTFVVKRNLFSGNSWNDCACIWGDWIHDPSRIVGNYFIANSSRELLQYACVTQFFGNPDSSFFHNVFLGNLTKGAVSGYPEYGPGDARHNYWGHATGPFNQWSNPDALGDTVDTLVVYDPWEVDTLFLQNVVEPISSPVSFALGFPYPNPFNSSVTIEYALTREQGVRLEIFDVLGRKVATLIEATQSPGVHSVLWHANGQATGLYFARLSAPETQHTAQTVKLLLMK